MKMNEFQNLTQEERKVIILNTGRKLNMSEGIIEKDFWVCWTLQYLFQRFKYKDFICFKGGTSLSKVYHCIERFSEDIDLSIDWSLLNVDKSFAYENKSNRKQDMFNKETNEITESYLGEIWLPLLKKDFSSLLNGEFDLYIEATDPQTICFQYPRSFKEDSILQIIRLEIGALAEPIPSSWNSLQTYISNAYPNIFDDKMIDIKVVNITRTFFEKATILHRESLRTNGNYPTRYSRHFYDLYQMINDGTADEAIHEMDILEMVVLFKKKFYPCKWAQYELILRGECRLIPNTNALKIFSKDYETMRNMIYGNCPLFDEIIQTIKKFECTFNEEIKNKWLEKG